MALSKTQVLNASLELCDVICNRYNTEELCESIVAEVELRAQARAWGETYIGRMVRSGVKVRLERKTLHEGNAFVA